MVGSPLVGKRRLCLRRRSWQRAWSPQLQSEVCQLKTVSMLRWSGNHWGGVPATAVLASMMSVYLFVFLLRATDTMSRDWGLPPKQT